MAHRVRPQPGVIFGVLLCLCVGCSAGQRVDEEAPPAVEGSTRVETTDTTESPIRPSLDVDGDGVDDEVDRCPDVPGPAEGQGCPEPDADGDGICSDWVIDAGYEDEFDCRERDLCPEQGPGSRVVGGSDGHGYLLVGCWEYRDWRDYFDARSECTLLYNPHRECMPPPRIPGNMAVSLYFESGSSDGELTSVQLDYLGAFAIDYFVERERAATFVLEGWATAADAAESGDAAALTALACDRAVTFRDSLVAYGYSADMFELHSRVEPDRDEPPMAWLIPFEADFHGEPCL